MIAKPVRASRRTRTAALLAARTAGCTCSPDVLWHSNRHARVSHDPWCPVLRDGEHRQVVFLTSAA